MKTIKTAFNLFCFLVITQSVIATPVNWIGGIGDWMDPTGWDSGTIPTSSQDVIISSGTVTLRVGDHGEAHSVEVGATARLNVYVKSSLSIFGSNDDAGLLNEGRTYVWGELNITNVSNDIPIIVSGIKNTDIFSVGVNGIVSIVSVKSGYGIYNYTSGVILNRGDISMIKVGFDNIRNLGEFNNEGDIELHDINTNGIFNRGDFTSIATGDISLQRGNIGILNNPNATFENFGFINMEETNYGINNKGNFLNEGTGDIWMTDGIQGLTNRNIGGVGNGDCINYGNINISDFLTGLRNEDYIFTDGMLYLANDNSLGLKNLSGQIVNDASFHVYGINESIFNESSIINQSDGFFFVDNIIENLTVNGYIENNGFMASSAEDEHTLDAAGTLINYGVLEDDYNTFSGDGLDNQQVYISRISETLEDGNDYVGLIDLVDDSNISIDDWKDNNTASYNVVGTYDSALNELSANSYAEGLERIYISIQIIASGNRRNTSLMIDIPASSRITGGSFDEALSSRSSGFSSDVKIYPSIVSTTFNIQYDETGDYPLDYHIYNTAGQCLLSGQSEIGSALISVEMPDYLADGMYYLILQQSGTIIKTERIFRQK